MDARPDPALIQELEKTLTEVTSEILKRSVKVAFKEYRVEKRESAILGTYYWDVYVFSFPEIGYKEAKLLTSEKRWRYIKFRVAKVLNRPFALRLIIKSAKRRTFDGFIIYALRKAREEQK